MGKIRYISVFLAAIFVATTSAEGCSELSDEIQASEIIAKILRNEPVSYQNVTINGSLNLDVKFTGLPTERIKRDKYQIEAYRLTENRTIIRPNITIKMSKIRGDLNFPNVKFEGIFDFEGTQISGDADLHGSEFGGGAIFKGASSARATLFESEFIKEADFDDAMLFDANFTGSRFHQNTIFRGTQFIGGDVDFERVQFMGNAIFENVQFGAKAFFKNAQFDRQAVFYRAQFNKDAYFKKTAFRGHADFREAHFGGKAEFTSASFYDATFSEAEFDSAASFLDSNFTNVAGFGKARFGRAVDFSNTQFASDANFPHAQFIGNAFFDNVSFNRTIDMTNAEFNRFYIDWRFIRDHLIYDGATYLALVKNYKDLERFDESNECYYDYRSRSPYKGLWDYLEWKFYGFGVAPWYPASWSLVIIIIFGSIFSMWISIKKWTFFEIDDGSDPKVKKLVLKEEELTLIDPYLFSLSQFTSGAASFIHPNTRLRPVVGKSTSLALIEKLLGSLFIALLIAAMSKTYLIR